MSGVKKKKARQKTLQNLKGALQGLLQSPKNRSKVVSDPPSQRQSVASREQTAPVFHEEQRNDARDSVPSNEIVYVMSKEAQLIPKLTDEQVLERHKRADENMKRAWLHLIEKYESIEDQGDVVDLTTGEIIEDNGHVRGLSAQHGSTASNGTDSNYVSVLSDLIEIDNTATNIWNENENEHEDENDDIYNNYNGESECDSDTSPIPEPD
ncbi:Scm3p LALA0_S05e08020g [Lachancea lanzarotensis]|uniref:LALA0S05e08020g1_1 n=1 Tax=Lachancea lanzarotensis TaxID=1245769 RepID=A0A0C7N3L7_9SACH|nr:uncharacterized protein LALA0_S05e08020g [Lachancea lanzarotensis]CEP62545.1 LALA0S05e08020g1_1 [Lachancea lanzarotensis]